MFVRLVYGMIIGLLFSFALPSDDIYDQKGYYMFPIRPGEVNYLSGSMGELRSTHFHSGIDIKTGGVQGYNVYAAADGHLSRVNVSTGGYGKALYIQHPNNTFTVYAHLRDFSKDVADYVRRQQYRKQSYVVDLFPKKGTFLYNKGDIIAASGNTGSSTAPHLHFEIRDENHQILDPLRFEFPEIRDSRVPEVRTVAFRSMDINSRINGRFGRVDFAANRDGNAFGLKDKVHITGKVGVEIYAFDRQNETNNRYGVPCVEFYHNDELIYSYHIKTLAFRDTRNVLVHTNYPEMIESRRRFHKLYIDDGNELQFYSSEGNGIINFDDTLIHNFMIKLWDVYGNYSETGFQVNSGDGPTRDSNEKYKSREVNVTDNVLELYKDFGDSTINHLTVYANRFRYELAPSYTSSKGAYYLWDLRDGLPDSIDYCGKVEDPDYKTSIPSGSEFTYFSDEMNLEFGKNTLFDTLYLRTKWEIDLDNDREIFKFFHSNVPVRRNIKITLKPALDYYQEKSAVYSIGSKGNLSYYGGEWNDEGITFYTRDLQNFTIATDTIPPTVKRLKVNQEDLRFIIDDELSGISSYNAYVNNEWVLMNYESKRSLIWSEKLDENIPFTGELVLSVKDNAGNETIYNSKI